MNVDGQDLINALVGQRNAAMDQVATLQAQLDGAAREIEALKEAAKPKASAKK